MLASISAVIITKNAADFLPDCLTSIDWVDEIVLLDSGSKDKTIELARAAGAKVLIHTDWQGYGIQRQRAQQYATSDYILMIDADERLTPKLKQAIQSILASPQDSNIVYSVTRRNYFLGQFINYSGWCNDQVIRLYARRCYHFNDKKVHESLVCSNARIVALHGNLLHFTCLNLITFQQKQLNYALIWAQERYQNGKKISFVDIFTHTFYAFLRTFILHGGILDGKRGYLISVVNAHYTFNKYAELWAMNFVYSRGYSKIE